MYNNDAPSATYRGYRRQALYALFRLFDEGMPSDSKIQPEGNEDLAIYDCNNQLMEVIQVKDLSDPLSVSSFKRSFFERIAMHCDPNSNTKVSIVSFGHVGPELNDALGGDQETAAKVAAKLEKSTTKETVKKGNIHSTPIPGLSATHAKNVVSKLKIHKVSEPALHRSVIQRLESTATGIDAARAFDLLMWWILTCSESQRVISREMAIAKLDRIGKFLSARAAHHDQWNRSILPIGPAELTERQKERLEESFFRGGRVRFDHIEADLDVPRGTTTADIHAAFEDCNVAVLHSASGQGKTTQAYRYAKDFAPKEFRFEVLPPDDLVHARDMALAIVGHAETIEVPTFVYVDVRPGNLYWVELIRELAMVNGIRILVTIREEDWARTAISAADFDYKEFTLEFDELQAAQLYDRLIGRGVEKKHLDFADAWEQFGPRKTLFEFAYFITQHQSLTDRIRIQLKAIELTVNESKRHPADLEFLRKIAVATAYEARVDLASLLKSSNLPAAQATISTFEDEYLIRVSDDGRYLEGFHAIRSEIITDVLVDPVICPWHVVAEQVLSHLFEEDLESFLLYAFSRRPDAANQLLKSLRGYSPTKWTGIRSVIVALMWYGLRSYTNNNVELLREVHDTCVGWWKMAIDWDLAMAKGPEGFKVFENLGDSWSEAKELSDKFRARQSSKDAVFEPVRDWLKSVSSDPATPATPQEWLAMSEVLFWVGHLSITTSVTQSVDFSRMNEAVATLTTHQLGRFFLGVRKCFPEKYGTWLGDAGEYVRNKIRKDAAMLALQESDNEVVGHFILDSDLNANSLQRPETEQAKVAASIHDLTIERVEVLAGVFPGKQRYGAIGYGHRTSLVPLPFDDADKPGVLAENLYPLWTPAFNANARGYAEIIFRPETWIEYFAIVNELRKSVIQAMQDLQRSVTKIQRSSSPPLVKPLDDPTGWDACRKKLREELLLPRNAVDEWGFVSESSKKTEKKIRSALERFDPVEKSLKEYTRTVSNFMQQAIESMILVPTLRYAQGQAGRAAVTEKVKEYGLHSNSIQLSIVNGIEAVKAVRALQLAIGRVFPNGDFFSIDDDLMENELSVFDATMTIWCNFVSPPRIDKAKHRKNSKRSRPNKLVSLRDLLVGTRHRLKSELQSLKKKGIVGQLQSESIPWNDRPALWIRYDVGHPVDILQAMSHVWDCLVAAFAPDRMNTVRSSLIDCFWQEVILIPTVRGKSLDGLVMPHLKAVKYQEPPSFEDSAWRLLQAKVDDETLRQLAVELCPSPESDGIFKRLISAWSELFQALDHLSDFRRLNVELDKLGEGMILAYLDRKGSQVSALLNSATEAMEDVAKMINSCDDINTHPNLKACAELLIRARGRLACPGDSNPKDNLTISQIVEWRDAVRQGLECVGVSRYFWLADVFGFDEWHYSQ